MDLRERTAELSRRAAGLFREHVAPRPMLAGGVAAAAVGLAAGLYLSAGMGWERPEQRLIAPPAKALAVLAKPAPITPMVDADGRTPDYVIGTDNLKRAPNPADAVQVIGPPTQPEQAFADEGSRRWWAPWTWGRGGAPDEEPDRYADPQAERREMARREMAAREMARREAAEREAARREAADRRYEERLARYEDQRRAYEEAMARRERRYGRDAWEEREAYDDEPPPYDPRDERPRWRPRYGY